MGARWTHTGNTELSRHSELARLFEGSEEFSQKYSWVVLVNHREFVEVVLAWAGNASTGEERKETIDRVAPVATFLDGSNGSIHRDQLTNVRIEVLQISRIVLEPIVERFIKRLGAVGEVERKLLHSVCLSSTKQSTREVELPGISTAGAILSAKGTSSANSGIMAV